MRFEGQVAIVTGAGRGIGFLELQRAIHEFAGEFDLVTARAETYVPMKC